MCKMKEDGSTESKLHTRTADSTMKVTMRLMTLQVHNIDDVEEAHAIALTESLNSLHNIAMEYNRMKCDS